MTDNSGWIPIPLPRSDLAQELGEMELFYREFDTSEHVDSEQWRRFLYDPLDDLVERGVVDDREGWRVVTTIINHHRPLNPRIGTCLLLKTQRSKEVAISIYKLEETHH
jgi:hypothetical protein